MVFPLGDTEKTRIRPVVTLGLILINVAVYVAQLALGPGFTTRYAATPWEITHVRDIPGPIAVDPAGDGAASTAPRLVLQGPVPFPVWGTLLTSMFLHNSPLHLVGNMLFLWIFGDNVEEVLGKARYLLFYLGCGLAGVLLQVAVDADSPIPTLGASGAIAGVMGAYLIWFPYHRVRVLLVRYVVEVPAVWVVGLWLVGQFFHSVGLIAHIHHRGGVAYLAHVGGAAVGIAVALLVPGRERVS